MNLSNCLSAFTILAALTLSLPARADIAPDDECYANALGQACDNAASDGDKLQPGVCKETMCTRATPDGAVTYACYRCEPVAQGMGGQPSEAGGAGAGGGGNSNSAGSPAAGAPTHAPGGASAGGASNGSAGSNTAGAKTGSSGASGDTKASSDNGGGCSVSHARGGAGLAAALAALGLMIAGLRRRRSLAS